MQQEQREERQTNPDETQDKAQNKSSNTSKDNPKKPMRTLNRDGSYNAVRVGLEKQAFTDLYLRLLTVSWRKFFLLVILVYFSITLFLPRAIFFRGQVPLKA